MKTCVRHDELVGTVRAGQWPRGCASELREHVAQCVPCSEEVEMLSAFALARKGAMDVATPPSPELLWWKAQLRRRREVMERLERPGFAISTATLAASVVILIAVFATAWKRIEWSRLATAVTPAGWNGWVVTALVTLLCGFAAVAVVVGLGLEERS